MRNFVTLTLFLASTCIALADFTMDMSSKEVRATSGTLAIEDLKVGETGMVYFPVVMCTRADVAYIDKEATLLQAKSSDYLNVTREPDNRVSLRTMKPDDYSQAIRILEFLGPCRPDANINEMFPIASINGTKTASGLLKASK